MREWFEIEDKPVEWNQRWTHLKHWCLARFVKALPPARRSFLRLFDMAPMEGIVWDYRALCIAHEARGGIWSVS
jgi:hypothetical protein